MVLSTESIVVLSGYFVKYISLRRGSIQLLVSHKRMVLSTESFVVLSGYFVNSISLMSKKTENIKLVPRTNEIKVLRFHKSERENLAYGRH